jgi:phage terminase small subunit
MRELSLKQSKFIDAYIANNGNGTKAAQEAGYNGTERTLEAIASENLSKPIIKVGIEAKRAEIEPKLEITVNKVLSDLENQRIKAEAKGDFSSAIAATRLQGQHLAMFREGIDFNDVQRQAEQQALTEVETIELRRIANIRLSEIA